MGVLLYVELVHVQVPQTQVPIGGAGHEQLTAGAEGAGHHRGVIHGRRPWQTTTRSHTSCPRPQPATRQSHRSSSPAQTFGGKVPQGHGAVRRPGNQVSGVEGQRADPDRAATGMLQHGLDVARHHGPDQRGGVGGTRGQELAAGAEAAAVDAVAVTRQRRERRLGEVPRVVHPEGFVARARGQQFAREGAAVDVIPMVLQPAQQRRHLDTRNRPHA